jgi:hypothetical protein
LRENFSVDLCHALRKIKIKIPDRKGEIWNHSNFVLFSKENRERNKISKNKRIIIKMSSSA